MAAVQTKVGTGGISQPNEFDRKRIERALAERSRYRFVKPLLRVVDGGFRIESPCCSRRVDSSGAVVDVALLLHRNQGEWSLYRKDHSAAQWLLHATYETLAALLEQLKVDPDQLFWQ
jgi:hypothetical protein